MKPRTMPPGASTRRREITPDDLERLATGQAIEDLEPLDDVIDDETRTLLATVADYFDKENPRSLYCQLPEQFQASLARIPADRWDDPKEFREVMIHTSRVDRALRKSLWAEYALSTQRGETLKIAAVCNNICSPSYFHALITKPDKVFFLFSPPVDYLQEMTSLQDLALVRLREILALPFDNGGKNDPKIIKLVLQAAAMVDQRIHGAPKQSIEQTNRNANLTVNLTGKLQDQAQPSMEEIDAKMKEIDERLKPGLPAPQESPMEHILGSLSSSRKRDPLAMPPVLIEDTDVGDE